MEITDSEVVVDKLVQYIKKYGITHGKAEVRPWGSYHLTMQAPTNAGVFLSHQMFGWGFTTEHAAAIALFRFAIDTNMAGHLVTWLGNDAYTELVILCGDIVRLDELKKQVEAEKKKLDEMEQVGFATLVEQAEARRETPTTGSENVSERIRHESDGL